MGKHKVPTLRNVDLRPARHFVKAYGHNGYFKSLEEIVHFYNTRDVPGAAGRAGSRRERQHRRTRQPRPDPRARSGIVAFMETLSDGYKK